MVKASIESNGHKDTITGDLIIIFMATQNGKDEGMVEYSLGSIAHGEADKDDFPLIFASWIDELFKSTMSESDYTKALLDVKEELDKRYKKAVEEENERFLNEVLERKENKNER